MFCESRFFCVFCFTCLVQPWITEPLRWLSRFKTCDRFCVFIFFILKCANFHNASRSFVLQRVHRWRKAGGAQTGEGRRDQHLLRCFGASVREVPQVGTKHVTRGRKTTTSNKKSLKTNIPFCNVHKGFIDFSTFILSCYLFYSSCFPLRIMMLSVLKNTKTPVKFWFLKNYLSPTFKVGFLFS